MDEKMIDLYDGICAYPSTVKRVILWPTSLAVTRKGWFGREIIVKKAKEPFVIIDFDDGYHMEQKCDSDQEGMETTRHILKMINGEDNNTKDT